MRFMHKAFFSLALLPLWASAQTINPNQIKPSTTNGYVLTTVGGATIWAPTAAGNPLVIQHNGSATGIDQALLNFDDSVPAPPTGNENVTFQTTSGGELSAYVPIPSIANSFQMQVIPPISGQYVIIYPTGFTTNILGGATVAATDTSAVVVVPPHFSFTWEGQVSWTFTNALATQAPYVNPANVTAVYAIGISGISSANVGSGFGPFYPGTMALGIGGQSMVPPGYSSNTNTQLQQVTALTALSGSTITGATASLTFGYSGETGAQSTASVPLVGLMVFYTGTAPPVSTALNVVPPLDYNVATNTLSMDPSAEFAGTSLAPTTVGRLPAASTLPDVLYAVSDGASATDCATGSGTTYVQCLSNGTSWLAYNANGGNIAGGALGSAVYQSGVGVSAVTAANITALTLCLTETGTGSAGAAPVWGSCAGSAATAWSAVTASTNTGQALLVGSGSTFGATGSGTITATAMPYSGLTGSVPTWNQNTTGTAAGLSGTPALPNGTTATTQTTGDNTTKVATDAFVIANAGTATAFSAITASTNTTAAMVVGSGASLGASGSGTITATAMPYSGLTGSVPTWNQNTTGTAANLSGTPTLPNGTAATTQTSSDNTTKLATTAFVQANVSGVAKTICGVTIALSISSIAPGGHTAPTGTCVNAVAGDIVKCGPAVATPTFHGVTGYDSTINSGNVLTIDPPYVNSPGVITIGVSSSLLNTLPSFTPGAMSLVCQVLR